MPCPAQTGGVTIVVGPDQDAVNVLVDSLALFLTREERRRSRYAQDHGNLGYVPDLWVQGIVQDSPAAALAAAQILQASTPSTLVSLADYTVRQTKPHIEYAFLRGEHETTELQRFEDEATKAPAGSDGGAAAEPDAGAAATAAAGQKDPKDPAAVPHAATLLATLTAVAAGLGGASGDGGGDADAAARAHDGDSGGNSGNGGGNGGGAALFHEINDGSRLVREFMRSIFKPHPLPVRQALIAQFTRGLYREAFVLVQQVDALGASPQRPLSADALRRVKRQLQLTEEGDFDIVLAFAEKLRRGVTYSALGDPRQREQQVLHLLTSF